MKKLYILAALLMATTSAQAGNAVSIEIEGKRINIEVPPNCSSMSCLKITAPGFSGFNSKRSDDDDDNAPAPEFNRSGAWRRSCGGGAANPASPSTPSCALRRDSRGT